MSNTSNLKQIKAVKVIPVIELQPLYMFDGVDKWPPTREELQALCREMLRPKKIASVNFLPGADLLVPVGSLFDHLDDLAEIFSYDVHAPTETELSGGYAFVENGVYVFGVEESSTISDAIEWELSVEQLTQNMRAEIRHACNYPFEAWLKNDQVVLWNKRDDVQYAVPFKDYRTEIRKATQQLKEFALAFVPIYAAKLNVPDPYEAAMWNFSKHRDWFEEQGVLVG
ncbi:hypothetical protein L0337_25430 [candidate division KSB1 bacterium]|nr:hypothetical protein [candidate division KSB1 bacterium]